MPGTLFVTGGGGFIGRRLLRALPPGQYAAVHCLSRAPRGDVVGAPPGTPVRWVLGDLGASRSYERHLDGVEAVVHLAAATGARGRDDYYRINVDGTGRLLEACARAGVRRVLHVSSIAAKYDEPRYHYGQSKREAEEVVRRCGLAYTIVRPTVVAGRGSPAWTRLETLATGPVAVLIGDGSVRLQPVYVDDVARALVEVLRDELFHGEAYDVGGPEVLTMEALLRRVRQARRGSSLRVIHLPYSPLVWTLGALERVIGARLPVNAGQLSVFVNDGTIEENALFLRLRPAMRSVDEMLQLVTRDG